MSRTKCPAIEDREATKAILDKFESLCESRGLKYTEVAKQLGISDRLAAAMYHGDYKSSLNVDVCKAIAVFFEVSLDWLTE